MSVISSISVHCKSCNLSNICIPIGLNESELTDLDKIIKRKKPLQRYQPLYCTGDSLSSFYAVRSGSLKSVITDSQGEEQIVNFYFPGDLFGFDGMDNEIHKNTVSALETAMVCELPMNILDNLTLDFPNLKRQVMKSMSTELSNENSLVMLLNKRSAEERVAQFLLNLSARFSERGYSPNAFHLTMTRGEIGNYLGLTIETVSRVMGKLQKSGVISVDGRLVEIPDLSKLEHVTPNLSIKFC